MAKKMLNALTIFSLSFVLISPSTAAIEIDEEDFGPSYSTMVADATVAKPLQLVSAVVGTATFIVSLPFSALGGNIDHAHQQLVVEPWQAMSRCLGCTVAEDNYYKSQNNKLNEVRIIVDQPSEVIIYTNDNVIVK